MALRRLKGKASKVGTAVHPLGNTTPTNPLDDRADNADLARRERGLPMRRDRKTAAPGVGARAAKGKKLGGGAQIKGGTL